jgi:hypothetical protein
VPERFGRMGEAMSLVTEKCWKCDRCGHSNSYAPA